MAKNKAKRVIEEADVVEVSLVKRAANGRKFLELIVPRSCRRRLHLVLRQRLKEVWQLSHRKIQIRRRMRQLRAVVTRVRAAIDL